MGGGYTCESIRGGVLGWNYDSVVLLKVMSTGTNREIDRIDTFQIYEKCIANLLASS
jgi:hypothetical protein